MKRVRRRRVAVRPAAAQNSLDPLRDPASARGVRFGVVGLAHVHEGRKSTGNAPGAGGATSEPDADAHPEAATPSDVESMQRTV